jgi:hypothetical protein
MADETKKWYLSRTIWVMGIGLAATLFQMAYGFVISPEEELALVTVIGLALRAITSKPLS